MCRHSASRASTGLRCSHPVTEPGSPSTTHSPSTPSMIEMEPMTLALQRIVCGLLLAGCVSAGPLADTATAPDSAEKKPFDIVKALVDARKLGEAEKTARELLAAAESSHGSESL